MLRFAVRRTLEAVAALIAATLLFFVAVFILPGDPIRALFGFRPPPPEVLAHLRALYGLDQPAYVQYWNYVPSLVRGDLGGRIRREREVEFLLLSVAEHGTAACDSPVCHCRASSPR